jgi:hypothetical protein
LLAEARSGPGQSGAGGRGRRAKAELVAVAAARLAAVDRRRADEFEAVRDFLSFPLPHHPIISL